MLRIIAPVVSVCVLALGACDPADGELARDDAAAADHADDHAEVPDEAARAERRLLREVRLSETHVVRFWALADGSGAVEESFHADLDRGSALPQDDVRHTLEELHRAVLPEEPVPAEMLAIDAFTAEHFDEEAIDEEPALDLLPEGGALLSAGEPEASAACIPWDWEGDKQWFVANFCTEGTYRDCVANWGTIYSWRYDTSWLKIYWFNQSHEASASVKGGHRNCWFDFWSFSNKCEWIEEFSHGVPNRMVQGWVWTGNGRRYVDITGSGECARVGMAQMWNPQSGSGTGGVSPNPAGPCNYIGEACCPQINVAGAYCDAVYDPQLVCKGGTCLH